ncbi:MAG: hypothetical protein MJ156_01785, partial [Alphaproteobacteria bacterium]|nr:hypothetical protein [Alphaproteobacteria bacterium]
QGATDTYNGVNTDNWSAGNEDGGGQCWCRITGEQSLDSTNPTSLDLKWAFYGWQDDCHRYCANQCGYFLHNTETLRRGMFNFTEIQYKDCEAGYYCPNNTIPYNNDGCKQQLCPEGYTSDAGASSITQCYRTIQPGKSINDNYEEIDCPADKYCPNEVKVYYQETQKSEIEVNCPTNYTSDPGSKTKQECYIAAAASTYVDCGLEETLIQSHTQSEYWHKEEGFSYPDNWNVDNNSWANVFYNDNVNEPGRTYVQGRSACSNLSSNKQYGTYTENEDVEFEPSRADGTYCWCKSEIPTGSKWINVNYTQPYNNETDCWFQCSGLCSNQMETVVAARKALHSTTTCRISTCPANHYCPSGVVHYGDEGNQTIKPCPAGTTSPAGSTSIEQCVVAACSANEYMEDNICKQCPNDWFSPEGSIGIGSCGRILHIGDYSIYLRSQKKTTPSLNVDVDGDGNADFFGNMTPVPTNINKDSNRKVKIQYNNQLLYLYDDTIKEIQQ